MYRQSKPSKSRNPSLKMFEYRHSFQKEYEGIIPVEADGRDTMLFFEFRCQFKLKKIGCDDEEFLGSEVFDMCVGDSIQDRNLLELWMKGHRLEHYGMLDDAIAKLISDAFQFGIQCSRDDYPKKTIPVVVNLVVCTVQQENETYDDAIDRSITGKKLYPIDLFPHSSGRNDHYRRLLDFDLQCWFLYHLERIMVVDEGGLSLIGQCVICCRKPTIGTQLSILPTCGGSDVHGFHYHCILRCLLTNGKCPICRIQAHQFPVFKLGDVPSDLIH